MFLETEENEMRKWQSYVRIMSQQRDAEIGIQKIGAKECTTAGEHHILAGPGIACHTNSVASHVRLKSGSLRR